MNLVKTAANSGSKQHDEGNKPNKTQNLQKLPEDLAIVFTVPKNQPKCHEKSVAITKNMQDSAESHISVLVWHRNDNKSVKQAVND